MTDADSPQPRVFRVRLRGVGPLTRTTVGTDPVTPEEEALTDALHWIWSWCLQVGRLQESLEVEWSDGAEIERRRAASRFSFDEHILAVTGWNLARAVQRAGAMFPLVKLREEHTEALRLLRNLYEHWDKQRATFQTPDAPKEQSAATFAEKFPQGRPWTIVFGESDWFLGGVLPVNEVTDALQELEAELLAVETRRRKHE